MSKGKIGCREKPNGGWRQLFFIQLGLI